MTVEAIESAVKHLSEKELAQFRDWFAEFEASQWDDKLSHDIEGGKLANLAKEAKGEYKSGKAKEL